MAEQENRTSKAKAPVKTIAGQPLWVWGVAGAVMLVAAIYFYRRNAANAQAGSGSGTGTGTGTGNKAGGPAQYPGALDLTVADLQSSPQISKTCPAGYTLATSGPHAGMCVRTGTSQGGPHPIDKPVPGEKTPKTPKAAAA